MIRNHGGHQSSSRVGGLPRSGWRISVKIFLACAALLLPVGCTTTGTTPAEPNKVSWYRGYIEKSRIVELPDERRLNLYCIGSGSPVVMLESGIGETAFTWWAV